MTKHERIASGMHVAIIMDGNGRWAEARGLPRTAGHVAGISTVRRIVEAAPAHGVSVLTLYAFSADNWKRPRLEVQALMRLLERYLRTEVASCADRGVRIEVLGRRDRLPSRVVDAIEKAERETAANSTLRLRLAVDYSSRDEMKRRLSQQDASVTPFGGQLQLASDPSMIDVDLLIRTGGEKRLSDFLLWESAYAELYFTDTAWPDFDAAALGHAIDDYARRHRRFGGIENVVRIAAAS